MADSLNIVGVMSGTSMDGLDLVLCSFSKSETGIDFEILAKQEIEFTKDLLQGLRQCRSMSALELAFLDIDMGEFIGQNVREFVKDIDVQVDYVASHGHTVFHEPSKGLTKQIGSGAEIAIHSGVKSIVDFRTNDVALGGQGAPLVPVGDWSLFNTYDACLNLGGIANISLKEEQVAFDISPCNLILNHVVADFNVSFDEDGLIGRKGNLHQELFNSLNDLDYYRKEAPKSLGAEFLDEELVPMLDKFAISSEDKLNTLYHHIAFQISKYLKTSNVLITGGGSHNSYLLELFESYSGHKFSAASSEIIDYKEAVIFAYLGYLRVNDCINVESKVTGSKKSNIGGSIYLP